MRSRSWLSAVFLLVVVVGAGACRKNVVQPIYRRPVILSVVAFPTTLGPGDSTMITVYATDPDGDSLVYDWEAYNGLIPKDAYPGNSYIYSTHRPSMIFYRSPTWPYPNTSAVVSCSVRAERGGGASRQVQIFFEN